MNIFRTKRKQEIIQVAIDLLKLAKQGDFDNGVEHNGISEGNQIAGQIIEDAERILSKYIK